MLPPLYNHIALARDLRPWSIASLSSITLVEDPRSRSIVHLLGLIDAASRCHPASAITKIASPCWGPTTMVHRPSVHTLYLPISSTQRLVFIRLRPSSFVSCTRDKRPAFSTAVTITIINPTGPSQVCMATATHPRLHIVLSASITFMKPRPGSRLSTFGTCHDNTHAHPPSSINISSSCYYFRIAYTQQSDSSFFMRTFHILPRSGYSKVIAYIFSTLVFYTPFECIRFATDRVVLHLFAKSMSRTLSNNQPFDTTIAFSCHA
jgi:hypothetical protein